MIRDQLVGRWTLVSFESQRSDGEVTNVGGSGVLFYDASGHMAVQRMHADRPLFASGDQQHGTPEEVQAAYEGYFAYFGEYEVNEEEQTVIHHIQGSLFPNWVGQDQKRFYAFSGNRLTLTTPPLVIGGITVTRVLVWEKTSY